MKKILSIMMLALACSAFAANTNLQAVENKPGVIEFVWQADTALSFAYDVTLARFNEVEHTAAYFADLASYDYNFTISDRPGYLTCSTDIVLHYGNNYTTIGNYGASAEIVASWQANWIASVASEVDYTLNPGYYVIFVEGLDEGFNTSEASIYTIVEIVDQAQGLQESLNNVQMNNKPSKYIDQNGQVKILKDGHVFNVFGNKIK